MRDRFWLAGVGIVAAVVLCAFGLPAPAQDCPGLVGQWPYGTAEAVEVVGGHIYFGNGPFFLVADIGPADTLEVIGEVLLTSVIRGIVISGSFAYVADQWSGLRVIDIGDPSDPFEVGSPFKPWAHGAHAVAVSGDQAYVLTGTDLQIIDISSPPSPALVGSYEVSGEKLAVSNGHAYVARGQNGFEVIDVREPSAPRHLATCRVPAQTVALSGSDHLAFAVGRGRLSIVDVNPPAEPEVVSTVDLSAHWGWSERPDIAVSHDRAYVASPSLIVVDVTSPTSPIEVSSIEIPGGRGRGVSVSGGYVFVAAYAHGLRVIDENTPAAPVEVAYRDNSGSMGGMDVDADHVYIVDRDRGVWVFDVGSPTSPRPVGLFDEIRRGVTLTISGDYAYAITERTLWIIDVSVPVSPAFVSTTDLPNLMAGDVVVSDHYAYVVGADALVVIDVENQAEPSVEGVLGWSLGSGPPAIKNSLISVSEGFAYVAFWTDGVWIIDVRIPSAPARVASFGSRGSVSTVVQSNHLVYVGSEEGMTVVDVSIPLAPAEIGFVPVEGLVNLMIRGERVWASTWAPGPMTRLIVFDVSTPSAPVEVGSVAAPVLWDMAGSDETAFAVSLWSGPFVFDSLNCPSPGPRRPDGRATP